MSTTQAPASGVPTKESRLSVCFACGFNSLFVWCVSVLGEACGAVFYISQGLKCPIMKDIKEKHKYPYKEFVRC